MALDPIDKSILKILQKDALAKLKDISAAISVNETLHKTDNSEKPSTSMVKVVPI